ncbi:MAG: GH3 auxin-responsive promoter family protein, partial [Alistipes sp.]|nr:GH3 auxin-responsive promoter family protein [Alistipes sp.]
MDRFRRHPLEAQQRALAERLKEGVKTSFGQERGLLSTWSAEEFTRRVEVFDYERFKPYLERMMRGERDVTASGRVVNYAQSSGTTSDRSKYIPVTRRSV